MIDPDEESKKAITEYQETAAYATNPAMLAANIGRGTVEAMKAAAENQSGGFANMMGVGFVNGMMGQMGVGQIVQNSLNQNNPGNWICSCGHNNKGKFCEECGKPRQDK